MNFIEKRIAELKQYQPDLTAPKDIEQFWDKTLEDVQAKPVCAFKTPVETPYPHIHASRVTFEGVDDTPLHACIYAPNLPEIKSCRVLSFSMATQVARAILRITRPG
ncbi:cephalosporin-C deacetylase-like acetyl esterase [Paenibacillus sp. RC254]